ncbi:CAF1-domain-containing protein [Xylaria arbuscula]|nr:CAF1-domain-containing protein [Xylaria arbuscula]
MATNYRNFWSTLPDFMGALAESRWVAIDVEMSGILSSGDIPLNSTAQARYRQVKEAAETFQILQVGFTFCKFDENTCHYETKTFGYYVSPLLHPSIIGSGILAKTLDRRFTTSTLTYNFLKDNSFPFFTAIDYGIPYLSREDELDVKRRGVQLRRLESLDISRLDPKHMYFYQFHKEKIEEVTESSEDVHLPLHGQEELPLSILEIRIIEQLLREDFPSLAIKTTPTGCMFVTGADPKKIAELQLLNAEAIERHIGIRHLFDALAGRDFASSVRSCWPMSSQLSSETHPHGHSTQGFNSISDMKKVESILKNKRSILVGHNLFYDLAFIYRTFFGTLPETVDEFLSTLHQLFPRLVDTKYMFSKGQEYLGSCPGSLSLRNLYSMYENRMYPVVRSTNNNTEQDHQSHHAGFKSKMTMKLFLKQTYHIKAFWSDTTRTPLMAYRLSSPTTSRANNPTLRRLENILDQERSQSDLDSIEALQPEPSATPAPSILTTEYSPLNASLAPTPTSLGLRPLEICSQLEIDIIPLWDCAFWREFGNKSPVAHGPAFEFV